MAEPILDIRDLRYRWPGRAGFTLSVDRLRLDHGETALLLGRSGSGKSTLLSLICGIMAPDQGQITLAGVEITGLGQPARDRVRAEQCGVIFQQFNLLPFGRVADNVALPLAFAPDRRRRVGDARHETERLLAALGLPPALMSARAGRLSVGQQQRVAVARALIGAPPLVLADEPTSALDADSQDRFLTLLFDQVRASGSTLLMVSHDARLATRFDHVMDMAELAPEAVP